MNFLETIEQYQPYDIQEEADRKIMMQYANLFEDILTRDNVYAHVMCSSWVVNKKRDKAVLFVS